MFNITTVVFDGPSLPFYLYLKVKNKIVSSILKMGAEDYSENLITSYRTSLYRDPGNHILTVCSFEASNAIQPISILLGEALV